MEQNDHKKLDISTIMLSMLSIGFLSYVIYILRHLGATLRVVAVLFMMMPYFISICRTLQHKGKATDKERWIFDMIALVLWIAHSIINGKLHRLFF